PTRRSSDLFQSLLVCHPVEFFPFLLRFGNFLVFLLNEDSLVALTDVLTYPDLHLKRKQRLNSDSDFVGKLRAFLLAVGYVGNHPEQSHFQQDRKSTRLNSSHVSISYAV